MACLRAVRSEFVNGASRCRSLHIRHVFDWRFDSLEARMVLDHEDVDRFEQSAP